MSHTVKCSVCKQAVILDTDGFMGRMVALDPDHRIHPHPEAAAPVRVAIVPDDQPYAPVAEFTDAEILEILHSEEPRRLVAKKFGVSITTLAAIWSGQKRPMAGIDYDEVRARRRRVGRSNWRNQHGQAA